MADATKKLEVRTSRKITCLTFDWKIENLPIFYYDDVILSPPFSAGDDLTWRLEIVPHGNLRNRSDIRVRRVSGNCKEVTCIVDLTISDSSGDTGDLIRSPWNLNISDVISTDFCSDTHFFDEEETFILSVRLRYASRSTGLSHDMIPPLKDINTVDP
jgi:hypothetical protein